VSAGKIVIEATGLRKSYGARAALDGVSLSVRAGEVVGLLGPNGAGKTTTLSILATLLDPDAGEVRVDGAAAKPAAMRRKLGFVPQAVALYPSLSGFRNLVLFARIHGLARLQAQEQAIRSLDEVGLADRAHDPVSILSGGMKRRLNLACGMVHGPELLLLDEPTVGVDPQSRERIQLAVRQLAEAGAAVIYSTHYMEEVERICDRALLIDSGRVVAAGTVAELIALGGSHPRLEIDFAAQPAAGWYDGVDGVSAAASIGADGTLVLSLANLAQVGELLDRARAAGGRVLEFRLHSPNLSDAFMALTGHALREPGAEFH
jgi:linearmycin/streptolysin S transport system ATP-binding protein